jgi:diguanylate cyclase (GGDEF)-like protein
MIMSALQTVKLLVVDDDEDDIYLIVEALEEVSGTRYSVTTASSVLAAMAALAKDSFDVIFSDYRLGPLTGIDFITHIRKAGIDTPVILLTGLADTVIDNAALKAGASDFVTKTSINPDVLDRSVRYALAHVDRQRLLHTVLKSTKSGVAVLDQDGKVSLWNPRFVDFAQVAFGENPGRMEMLVSHAVKAAEQDIIIGDQIVEPHITNLPDGGSVLVLHDVTVRVRDLKEREIAEQNIRRIALQDTLTGLPNRMAFNDYLDSCIADAGRNGTQVAVLSFDFNRFKEVNDLFGHAAGDQLLRSVATRLGPVLTNDEYAARLGGDEFVVVQRNATQESATELAERLVATLSVPVDCELRVIEASVSVGVAIHPAQGLNRQELLANADLAMYRGKAEDSAPICIFDADMDQFVRNRRKMAHDLRSAIQNSELKLHFQPQFSAESESLVGLEALLRWKNHSRGIVSPAEFIPVAEENGMINEIDEWVLREACSTTVKWGGINRIAVNISAKAICQTGIVATMRTILLETGLAPTRLELEVTETALIHDLNRALHNLRQIKALGISIAMDDFGTGYSSLSLLNSFPFDRIKIDKSFIQHAGNSFRTDAIFRTVIGLGSVLKVPVLVEGVETRQQMEFAVAAGCEEVQGFYLGQPLSMEDIDAVVGSTVGPITSHHFQHLLPSPERSLQRA